MGFVLKQKNHTHSHIYRIMKGKGPKMETDEEQKVKQYIHWNSFTLHTNTNRFRLFFCRFSKTKNVVRFAFFYYIVWNKVNKKP